MTAIVQGRVDRQKGKRYSSETEHLWLTDATERPGAAVAIVGERTVCGWRPEFWASEMDRARNSRRRGARVRGRVVTVTGVLQAVKDATPYPPRLRYKREPVPSYLAMQASDVDMSVAKVEVDPRDACKRIGLCVPCVERIANPTCEHEDCKDHPEIGFACWMEREKTR
jgi:hypothetical protein